MSTPENDPPNRNEKEFISSIKKECEKGFGFVPLVGAGLSAPSGVPLIREIHEYLIKCIALALGINRDNVPDLNGTPAYHKGWRWHPQSDEWPPHHSGQSYSVEDKKWQKLIGTALEKMVTKLEYSPGKWREVPEIEVFREAYGATAEWRSSLHFLARLRYKQIDEEYEGESYKIRTLRLGPVDPDVIDNFFLNVVLGKVPTLGHRMLARLASPLRISTVITLNFEDLIEQAFEEIGNFLTVYAVHLDTGLPSYHSQFGKHSLIKMHGDRYGLRADYTLDEKPDEEDCRHFTSYLSGAAITPEAFFEARRRKCDKEHAKESKKASNETTEGDSSTSDSTIWQKFRTSIAPVFLSLEDSNKEVRGEYEEEAGTKSEEKPEPEPEDETISGIGLRNHLLVVGLSGKEDRIMRMIQASRDVFKDKGAPLKVFWISYSREDFIIATARLKEIYNKKDEYTANCKVIQHQFPGLLFFNLYQQLTGAIPPNGAIFPSQARTPVPPERLADENKQKEFRSVCDKINEAIDDCCRTNNKNKRKLIVIHGKEKKSYGAMTAAAQSFNYQLDKFRQAIWIDLDEIECTDELFEVLLATIARKAGIVDWMPVLAQDREARREERQDTKELTRARQQELARLTNHPNRDWVIYLNSRGGGAGSSFVTVDEADDRPNGWIDRNKNEGSASDDNKTDEQDSFLKLIDGICIGQCPNISIVLLCYGKSHDKNVAKSSILDAIQKVNVENKRFHKDSAAKIISIDKEDTEEKKSDIGKAEGVADKALRWREEDNKIDSAKNRFLHALISVNRIRSPALLWTWPFHESTKNLGGNQQAEDRMKKTSKWLDELEEEDVIRRQRGGFVWMRSDVRRILRREFRTKDKEGGYDSSIRIHQGLAEWYGRLHVSSKNARPATEAVYHRSIQVKFILMRLALISDTDSKDINEEIVKEQSHRIIQALESSLRILRQARPSILASGFTQGTCRRLENLRKRLVGMREIGAAAIAGSPEETGGDLAEGFKAIQVHEKELDLVKQILYLLCRIRNLTLTLEMDVSQEIGDGHSSRKKLNELTNPCEQTNTPYLHKKSDVIRWENKYASLGIEARSEERPEERTARVFRTYDYPFIVEENGKKRGPSGITVG